VRDRTSLAIHAHLVRPTRFTLDVDLTFAPGITVLFGPSGAGKSTLLNILAGLVIPDTGRVTLGEQIFQDSTTGRWVLPHMRHVAYVFQSLALFPHMNVVANVAYGIDRARPLTERHSLAMTSLKRFAAGHLAQRIPSTLSGGEAQRVALARALAIEPRAILLDEPFASLDGTLRQSLTAEVRTLGESLGVPIVHVTHQRREAIALGGRVVRLEAGKVVASGGTEVLPLDGEE
jgi:molybdate transport system ATP-binding protein